MVHRAAAKRGEYHKFRRPWIPAVIEAVKGDLHYRVKLGDGKILGVHHNKLKFRRSTVPVSDGEKAPADNLPDVAPEEDAADSLADVAPGRETADSLPGVASGDLSDVCPVPGPREPREEAVCAQSGASDDVLLQLKEPERIEGACDGAQSSGDLIYPREAPVPGPDSDVLCGHAGDSIPTAVSSPGLLSDVDVDPVPVTVPPGVRAGDVTDSVQVATAGTVLRRSARESKPPDFLVLRHVFTESF